MIYALGFFFDAGAGTCVWSANDAALERFGDAVDVDELPITEALRRELRELITGFDSSIDWEDPAAPSPWSRDTEEAFNLAAAAVVGRLRHELRGEFAITARLETVPGGTGRSR